MKYPCLRDLRIGGISFRQGFLESGIRLSDINIQHDRSISPQSHPSPHRSLPRRIDQHSLIHRPPSSPQYNQTLSLAEDSNVGAYWWRQRRQRGGSWSSNCEAASGINPLDSSAIFDHSWRRLWGFFDSHTGPFDLRFAQPNRGIAPGRPLSDLRSRVSFHRRVSSQIYGFVSPPRVSFHTNQIRNRSRFVTSIFDISPPLPSELHPRFAMIFNSHRRMEESPPLAVAISDPDRKI